MRNWRDNPRLRDLSMRTSVNYNLSAFSMRPVDHEEHLPASLSNLLNLQTDIPRVAKNTKLMNQIEAAVRRVPTAHHLLQGDSRDLSMLDDRSVHLIVTSPPYWTLKKYPEQNCQLGGVPELRNLSAAIGQSLATLFPCSRSGRPPRLCRG